MALARRHVFQVVSPVGNLEFRPNIERILRGSLAEESKSTYFDLEIPLDLAQFSEPMAALESLRGLRSMRCSAIPHFSIDYECRKQLSGNDLFVGKIRH
ncbi:MAG: hypothetical protein ACLPWG_22260 [Steroidobacteraceae bacterium]